MENNFVYVHPELVTDGSVIHIQADNLPLAWEKSICELLKHGVRIKTQYDKEDDFPSIDTTAIIEVKNPFAEPRIHKCFPGGIEDLEIYKQEVLDGIHDHWIDPENGKWEYSYHERLFGYTVPGITEVNFQGDTPYPLKPINQIEAVIKALKDCPYTRRAQAITWKPWEDLGIGDPACLQSMWFRVINDKLQMNVRMRSNDAFDAAFMNMYAFTELQKYVADEIGFPVGKYIHIADSYHIYGYALPKVETLIKAIAERPFEKRVFRTDDEMVQEMIEEAKVKIKNSIEEEKKSGRKGI